MKKILIDRDDDIASVADQVIAEVEGELVLVVPKGSALKSSVGNFRILKREAEAVGKKILIESVDTEVLGLAEKAGIEGFHPLFREDRAKSFSDIRIHEKEASLGSEPTLSEVRRAVSIKIGKGGKTTKKITEEPVVLPPSPAHPEELDEITRRDREEGEHFAAQEKRFAELKALKRSAPPPIPAPGAATAKPIANDEAEVRPPRRFRIGLRGVIVLVAVLVLVVGGVWVADRFFGSARVSVAFKTMLYDKTVQVLASKSSPKSSGAQIVLAADALSDTKNTTQFFPATGRAVVSLKATGRVTIINAYSSDAQSLVATTRFATPDGKIFRIDNPVTVPGAEIKDGKIIPSSIEVNVTADRPGVDYNVGPVAKLTIPGFKDTPKFDGFYGQFKDKTTGGFVGERAVPTTDDIAKAKEKVTDILKTSLAANFLNNRPEDLKVLDGASDFSVARFTVNSNTDDKGQFSVFGEARYRAVVFRESDLKSALIALVANDRVDLGFRSVDIGYQDPKVDFVQGTLTFTVTAKGVIAPVVDRDALTTKLLGKDVTSARSVIGALPDLSNAKISLYPIWLGSIPTDARRVDLIIE